MATRREELTVVAENLLGCCPPHITREDWAVQQVRQLLEKNERQTAEVASLREQVERWIHHCLRYRAQLRKEQDKKKNK